MVINTNLYSSKSFPPGWYCIIASKKIKLINRPYSLHRFGLDLVIWRNDKQKIRIFIDKCPHRSAKLSLGKIRNDNIICPFHSFSFNAEGKCTYAPEFDKAIPGLCANTFEAREEIGMIWLKYGNPTHEFPLERLNQIHNFFSGKYTQIKKTWHAHITRCIENQLDYTHLLAVHSNTIGRNFKVPVNPRFKLVNNSILSYHRDNDQPSSEYLFPNTWILHVSKQMKLMVFFIPISPSQTQFYIRTYTNWAKSFPLRWVFNRITNIANRVILKQDQRVVESQGVEPSILANNELLMKHDGAIRLFRQIWNIK